jgi:hypothetical protein
MSFLPIAKAIVLFAHDIGSEIMTERRKAREQRKAEQKAGLSHRDVEHIQAQIRSASRPGPKP